MQDFYLIFFYHYRLSCVLAFSWVYEMRQLCKLCFFFTISTSLMQFSFSFVIIIQYQQFYFVFHFTVSFRYQELFFLLVFFFCMMYVFSSQRLNGLREISQQYFVLYYFCTIYKFLQFLFIQSSYSIGCFFRRHKPDFFFSLEQVSESEKKRFEAFFLL